MFICNNCSKQYKNKGSFEKHVNACVPAEEPKVEEPVQEEPVQEIEQQPVEAKSELTCGNCSKQYKSKACYEKHMKICSPSVDETEQPVEEQPIEENVAEQQQEEEQNNGELSLGDMREAFFILMHKYNAIKSRNEELEAIAETHKNCVPGGQRIIERNNNYNMTNNITINIYNYNLLYPDGTSENVARRYEVENNDRDELDYHGMPLIQNKDSMIDLIGDSVKQALKEAFKYI